MWSVSMSKRVKSSIGFLYVLILSILLVPSMAFPGDSIMEALKKTPVRIDFNDVGEESGDEADTPGKSAMKIAVAAMISPKFTYKYYVELLNLIGERMEKQTVFVQKKTYAEVNALLKERKIDVAFVCSGPYVSGKREFGMEIIAVPVCHGKKVYYSYFIASKKSGITTFDDFKNKVFAFTDPLSNTGCMVPTYYLARRHEMPETFFKKTFFSHSHDNSILAVSEGLADGASVDSLIYDFLSVKRPDLTIKTIVVERSDPYGIPPVVVHPDMDTKTKEKLKELFLTIHRDPMGHACLENLQIDRFEEGYDADYDTVRALQIFLKKR